MQVDNTNQLSLQQTIPAYTPQQLEAMGEKEVTISGRPAWSESATFNVDTSASELTTSDKNMVQTIVGRVFDASPSGDALAVRGHEDDSASAQAFVDAIAAWRSSAGQSANLTPATLAEIAKQSSQTGAPLSEDILANAAGYLSGIRTQ